MVKSILPKNAAAAFFSVTLILTITYFIVVSLRVAVRHSNRALGVDDYLMVIGAICTTPMVIGIMGGTFYGLGTRDHEIAAADPSGRMRIQGNIYFFLFQASYVAALPFIKASICVALLRITQSKTYAYPLWGIIILSSASALSGVVAGLINCAPISASWDKSLGTCNTHGLLQKTTLVISATTILTDWACAIIPSFIVWGLQMKRKQKLTVCGILALGVIASVSTLLRLPYVSSYSHKVDLLYEWGFLSFWTGCECALGIIAGSLPSLRPLLKKYGWSSSKSHERHGDTPNQRSVPLNSMRGQTTAIVQGKAGEWERLDDNSSQKHIIIKSTQVDVNWSESTSL
ncbi:hypothetical protein F4804DRAFT_351303 [Jackrogersella minutella]|nr:hypothetical protein F4804DRAFT_351303 [Jackrogersella minutella]